MRIYTLANRPWRGPSLTATASLCCIGLRLQLAQRKLECCRSEQALSAARVELETTQRALAASRLRLARECKRQGGDPFSCLLPPARNEALGVALTRKLVDAVSAHCQLHHVTVQVLVLVLVQAQAQVQVQVGLNIAGYPEKGHTVQELMERADCAGCAGCARHAMCWARAERLGMKMAGRLPVLFRPALSVSVK